MSQRKKMARDVFRVIISELGKRRNAAKEQFRAGRGQKFGFITYLNWLGAEVARVGSKAIDLRKQNDDAL